MSGALAPGSVVGIIGGGQLGQMLTIAAHELGYRTAVLTPEEASPAAAVADSVVLGALGDPAALAKLAAQSAVVTFETEHVPAEALERVRTSAPVAVRPGPAGLARLQDRLFQRRLLAELGLAQTPHLPVHDLASLREAAAAAPAAGILKWRRGGYDGLGQRRVGGGTSLAAAWAGLDQRPCVLEEIVPFARELSVTVARTASGELVHYALAENLHRGGILHTTRAPAEVEPATRDQAIGIGRRVAEALGHVGALTVELFELADGALLVNEVAPRVHNAAHWTWGACVTSQFEQHIRAICDLPLGDPRQVSGAATVNLLGDLWDRGAPDLAALAHAEGCRLHLYGKRPRPGRKMGHLLVLAGDGAAALERANRLYDDVLARRSAGI